MLFLLLSQPFCFCTLRPRSPEPVQVLSTFSDCFSGAGFSLHKWRLWHPLPLGSCTLSQFGTIKHLLLLWAPTAPLPCRICRHVQVSITSFSLELPHSRLHSRKLLSQETRPRVFPTTGKEARTQTTMGASSGSLPGVGNAHSQVLGGAEYSPPQPKPGKCTAKCSLPLQLPAANP